MVVSQRFNFNANAEYTTHFVIDSVGWPGYDCRDGRAVETMVSRGTLWVRVGNQSVFVAGATCLLAVSAVVVFVLVRRYRKNQQRGTPLLSDIE